MQYLEVGPEVMDDGVELAADGALGVADGCRAALELLAEVPEPDKRTGLLAMADVRATVPVLADAVAHLDGAIVDLAVLVAHIERLRHTLEDLSSVVRLSSMLRESLAAVETTLARVVEVESLLGAADGLGFVGADRHRGRREDIGILTRRAANVLDLHVDELPGGIARISGYANYFQPPERERRRGFLRRRR